MDGWIRTGWKGKAKFRYLSDEDGLDQGGLILKNLTNFIGNDFRCLVFLLYVIRTW